MSELLVIARLRIGAGHQETVAIAARELIAAAREEPGVIFFAGYRNVTDPGELTLVERYSSAEAFEAHLASPHYQRIAVGTILPHLESRTIEQFEPLPGLT
jgi:quinol monooxygenase YgiN